MQSIEITAKSVAEATKMAAAKLGVEPDNLTVTVIEETKGLFGKSNVRVKAEVINAPTPVAATPQQTESAKAETASEPGAKTSGGASRGGPARGGRGKKAESEVEPPAESREDSDPAPKAEEAELVAVAPSRGRRGSRRPEPAAGASSGGSEDGDAPRDEPAEDANEPAVNATMEDGERFVTLIQDLMGKAGLTVKVDAREVQGRYVTIELDGKDAAYLVGKQGEVLNATQYLVNIIAGRRFNNGVRATLDGNNYRRRREARLETMATELARQVKNRGEEAVLDALPAFERRVVHKVLSTVEGITTYSEGEEPNRRVVIAPAD